MADRELWCLVCLYVGPRPGLDDDASAELDMLTVVNGQMVCLRHVPCAQDSQHDTLISGVRFESNGEFTHLSEYQDWRARQALAVPSSKEPTE